MFVHLIVHFEVYQQFCDVPKAKLHPIHPDYQK